MKENQDQKAKYKLHFNNIDLDKGRITHKNSASPDFLPPFLNSFP